MANNTYREMVETLERAFDHFNEKLFNSELTVPVIAILSQGTRSRMLGWHWPNKWKVGEDTINELNICAEVLSNRTTAEVMGTLLHEMVHLQNHMKGVKDCNSAQYHNKHFKTAAEAIGFDVHKMRARGFAHTVIPEGSPLEESVDAYIKENDVSFPLSRVVHRNTYTRMFAATVYEEDKAKLRRLKEKHGYASEKDLLNDMIRVFEQSLLKSEGN